MRAQKGVKPTGRFAWLPLGAPQAVLGGAMDGHSPQGDDNGSCEYDQMGVAGFGGVGGRWVGCPGAVESSGRSQGLRESLKPQNRHTPFLGFGRER